ncbi:hypothetical protein [Nocardioides sp.]|uniref:hypothetical protein n=1 Tax=Nocardioides sp. TaxID=35761 RepID=UPI0031FEE881|nr:hypothetical protein [Nocardioides sp.]
MTPPPSDMTPERVAELEKQLKDAAAQVAEVQAQLAQAQGGTTTPAAPTTTPGWAGAVPSVPYGLPQQGAMVAGQPVDLTAMLGPAMAKQVRDSLSHLALDPRVTEALGGVPGLAGPATAESVDRLADPPRQVPFSFRIASFWSWSWWEAFSVMMVVVAPIALWGFFPRLIPGAFILGVLAIVVVRGRKYLKRVGLLKWGKVATVTNSDEISRGTYYSGTTYQNMLVRQANGWDVTKRFYSGPMSKTKIEYSLDGTNGSLTLRGLPYANGVVLANSRKPATALCVSSFTYPVKPDVNGDWQRGGISPWSWLGMLFAICLHVAVVVGGVYAVYGLWLN